jgi:mycothiol synthase
MGHPEAVRFPKTVGRLAPVLLRALSRSRLPPPQLLMWLPATAPLDEPVPPAGYTVRGLTAADEPGWWQLLNAGGELGAWDLERLRRDAAGGLVPSAQRFVAAGDQIVACAGVYDRTRFDLAAWEIGWVAAHPAHRGRGLGRCVTAAAARASRLLLPRPTYLLTDDHRLPAIRTYLGLGFVPDCTAAGQTQRWARLLKQLGPPYLGLLATLPGWGREGGKGRHDARIDCGPKAA